ncbi:MAG: Biopolymer transport protein ExbD/TolR [Myxococcaceae bacterium]|nr:Biopolymer transport protein ExbD/TolR [Myxococcaceae bacterium]
MAGGAGDGEEDMISGINVTPLVDVVLVLLIILMVTAQYAAEKDTIPMDLPQASSGDTAQPTTLSVSIDKDGKYFINAEPLDLEQMRSKVRDAHKKDADTRAVIAADGRVSHAQVIKVIDLLRQEKVTKFAINVRPEDLGGAKK